MFKRDTVSLSEIGSRLLERGRGRSRVWILEVNNISTCSYKNSHCPLGKALNKLFYCET